MMIPHIWVEPELLAEIEYRAKSAEGKVRHPFLRGAAGGFVMKEKDAFDQWWQWAEKPVDSVLMIPTELHDAVMALSPDNRRDRAKVNEAARQAEQSEDR
jgi:hypothetical protein